MKHTYTKKPVDIEAFQVHKSMIHLQHATDVPEWIVAAIESKDIIFNGDDYFCKTLEGDHKVTWGDYIIKGVKGEIYPCKPDIFEMTYTKKV